jgi:two-component system chemotaxis response regulator CheY
MSAPPDRFDLASLKVLIVSDNAFERRLVMDLLIALGVKDISTADDAIAAFAQLMLKKPGLVIADAEMAPFSGFMLVKEIRKSPIALKEVPIVLITAETSPDYAQMALNAGANNLLQKPVSAALMRQCLEDAATRPRAAAPPKPYAGPERRSRTPENYIGPRRRKTDALAAMDRAQRAMILGCINEARAHFARWGESGAPTLLDAGRIALDKAMTAAIQAKADETLTRAIAGAIRLTDAARIGLADQHVLDVSLVAARAVISAPSARNSMRQALAEAVSEVADIRDAS